MSMIDDVSDIRSYYDEATESELNRLTRHQLERDITLHYLANHLPSEGNILEVGTGAGTIAIELARRGYKVTAVDMSEKMIDLCKKMVSAMGLENSVTFHVRDARDLRGLRESHFDAVLMLGPLYHLVYKQDRVAALKEAYRLLTPGGKIFSSFISRYGFWGDVIKNIPEAINRQADIVSIMKHGKDADKLAEGGFRGYFAKLSEISPLHRNIGFKTLLLAGVEPCISSDDETYNNLQGDLRQLWFDFLFELSTEKSIIAASSHLLYIGQKPVHD